MSHGAARAGARAGRAGRGPSPSLRGVVGSRRAGCGWAAAVVRHDGRPVGARPGRCRVTRPEGARAAESACCPLPPVGQIQG